jgi:hypothetical protein
MKWVLFVRGGMGVYLTPKFNARSVPFVIKIMQADTMPACVIIVKLN